MLFDQRNLPFFRALLKLIQDQASASTVHWAIHFQSHPQIGIRFLWRTICCGNVLTPFPGATPPPAKLKAQMWKSAIHLPLVTSIPLVCFEHDRGLVVVSLHKNGIRSDSGSHTLSSPSDCWICLHLCDSPARRSRCQANHEMLSWWHDGQATFDHTSQPFYTLVKWEIPSSQHLLYCRLFQKNLPATQHSAAQVLGSINIERLLVSMSVLQRQLAMQEVLNPNEGFSTLLSASSKFPVLNLCRSSINAIIQPEGLKLEEPVCTATSKRIDEDCGGVSVVSGTIPCLQVVCHVSLAVTNRTSLSTKCWKAFWKLEIKLIQILDTPYGNFVKEMHRAGSFKQLTPEPKIEPKGNMLRYWFLGFLVLPSNLIMAPLKYLIHKHICPYTPYVSTSNIWLTFWFLHSYTIGASLYNT